MSELSQAKRALRALVRSAVLAMDPAERAAAEQAIRANFLDAPGRERARTVLLYASCFPDEVATGPLLDRIRAEGRILACPRVDRTARRLRLHLIDDPARDLVAGLMGIPEPAADRPEVDIQSIDWVLVPGVAFDHRGGRLGRGGGYYDRLLAELPGSVPRWSLALEPQVLDEIPLEPHDRRVHGLIRAGGLSPTENSGDQRSA